MSKISRGYSKRNLQNQARRIQRSILRKKRSVRGKRLTKEEKKVRVEKLARRREEKQKRKLLRAHAIENGQITNIQKTLLRILGAEELDALGKKLGFIKRASAQITVLSFVYSVSFGFFGNGNMSLVSLTGGLSTFFFIDVSCQALSARINSECSVRLLKSVLKKLMSCQLEIGLGTFVFKGLSIFNGIYLHDSTQITLNEQLSEDFKGQGGGASSAAAKLDCICEIINPRIVSLKITHATTNDQIHSTEILKHIKSKSLVIRDLGYFSVGVLKGIQEKFAYFISRLSITTNVYLNASDTEPLNVPAYLAKLAENGQSSLNIKVFVGKTEKFETRLVAEKVPQHVAKQRGNKFKEQRKKAATPEYLAWSNFSIFITNIPETVFSGEMIICLYKIRWQIELLFKNLKSNIEIDIMKGQNKNRINTLLYGRLITIAIFFVIQNYATQVSPAGREISPDKLAKFLKNENQLHQAFRNNTLADLLMWLGHDVERYCKQKRKRKTTRESLEESLEKENRRKNQQCAPKMYVKEENEINMVHEVDLEAISRIKLG